ncbi:NADP-dependent oxidoreductase [Embleya sp. NPDC001921]
MRAVAFHDFGDSPASTELPTPEPGPGEVLVRVRAASLNGFDLGVLGGMMRGVLEYDFPVVLGKDFAGEIAASGAGVTGLNVGDAVFGVVMRPALGPGSFAQYVVVNADYGLARIPDGLAPTRAAALALAGTAALNAVDAVSPAPGETVLVVGATGGVGAYAVQLAASRGCTVIATAEPGAQAAFVTGLGATHTVEPAELPDQVQAIAPDGVQAALHLAGEGPVVAGLLAPGGRLASTLHYAPDAVTRGITSTTIMADPSAATLGRLAAEAASGRLRIPVARTYGLDEVPQAIAEFTRGAVGKFVVHI